MNCPHCQKELPENYGAAWCPFCGKNLPAPGAGSGSSKLMPVKINWLIFFGVLLAPAVLTLFGAMARWDGLAIGSPLIGGGVAGIVCGVMLARRIGRTLGIRIVLGFLFTAVFAVLSFALGFAGCVATGNFP